MKKVRITPKTNKPKSIKKKASVVIYDDEEVESVETKPKNFFEVQNDEDILMQEMLGMNYTVFIVPQYLKQAKEIKWQIIDYLNDSQLIPTKRKTKTFTYNDKSVTIIDGFERFNKTQTLMYIQKLYNRIISEGVRKGSKGKECVLCCEEITHWIDIRIREAENEEFKNYKPARKKPVKKEKERDNRTLENIWKSEELSYEKLIAILKKEHHSIKSSFVNTIDNKLTWTEIPIKGFQQYLAGFIHTCIKKKFITEVISAPDYVDILNNTFNNIIPSLNLFKSINTTPPKSRKYLEPFKNLEKYS